MPRRLYWICQIAGWTTYSAVNALFAILFQPRPLHPASLAFNFVLGGAGLLLTHLLRAYIYRVKWMELPLSSLLPRVLAASVLIGVVLSAILGLIWIATEKALDWGLLYRVLTVTVFNFSIMALLWQVLYFGVQFFRRYQNQKLRALEMQLAAQEAQLRALRSQMNPHFLFNCLNSLRGLIGEDPAAAQGMVTRLSLLLRHVLQSDRVRTVPLEVELEAVEHYLALERIRFEERLRTKLEVEPAARRAQIPPMMLQTLVENAIKHGLSQLPAGGEVHIGAAARDALLEISVFNHGRLLPATGSTCLGLDNIRDRLRLLHGDAARFTLSEEDGGVIARVRLPLQAAEEAA
jgi:sensor histidine kinase YesM